MKWWLGQIPYGQMISLPNSLQTYLDFQRGIWFFFLSHIKKKKKYKKNASIKLNETAKSRHSLNTWWNWTVKEVMKLMKTITATLNTKARAVTVQCTQMRDRICRWSLGEHHICKILMTCKKRVVNRLQTDIIFCLSQYFLLELGTRRNTHEITAASFHSHMKENIVCHPPENWIPKQP